MKKFYTLIFLCIISFNTIHAEIEWDLSDDGTLTISGTDMRNYGDIYGEIYGDINGEEVGWLTPWYYQKKEIKKVVIKDGVTSIGGNAFSGCINLVSVKIPNSVTRIGYNAFQSCTSLSSVSIPNSVKGIEETAFAYCKGLTSINIPSSVTSVGESVFYGCSSLTSVIIGMKNIQGGIFDNHSSITSLTILESVTSIGSQAFQNCSGLTSVTIPNSVTSIAASAFSNCTRLSSVHITELVSWCKIKFENVEANPLYYAKHLYLNGKEVDNIEIPDGTTNIGAYSFYNCKSLTSIKISNSVKSIGTAAFYNCSGLISVTIGNSVTSIKGSVFSGCTKIKEVYSWNTTPPSAENTAFNGMNTLHAKVFVPEGSSDAYKYAPGWMNFLNVFEMEYTPVLSEAAPITISDSKTDVTKGYYKEKTVTYVRENNAINKDNYASFCLPFAVDPSDAQFKAVYVPVGIALYNTETNTLRIGFYKSNQIIPAGTPFLAKLAVDDKVEIKNALPINYDSNEPAVKAKVIRTFDFHERSGIMSENDNYSINFTGTYKKISPANACTFNIDGSAGPSANVFPFRAYIALTKNSTNAKIIASFDEDVETTGIKELLISNDKSPVYDLNGRVVNEKSQKSGIYIKNGKKYVK